MKTQRVTGKYCPDCKDVRPREEFSSNPARRDGLPSYCRKHNNERLRKRREQNRGEFNSYHRNYQAKKRNGKKISLRPASGPRCACGKVLYFYEAGKCLTCSRNSIIARREEKVNLTTDHVRERNRNNYHKAIAAVD